MGFRYQFGFRPAQGLTREFIQGDPIHSQTVLAIVEKIRIVERSQNDAGFLGETVLHPRAIRELRLWGLIMNVKVYYHQSPERLSGGILGLPHDTFDKIPADAKALRNDPPLQPVIEEHRPDTGLLFGNAFRPG